MRKHAFEECHMLLIAASRNILEGPLYIQQLCPHNGQSIDYSNQIASISYTRNDDPYNDNGDDGDDDDDDDDNTYIIE